MPETVFGRELFDPFYADAKPLLEKHWREIATFLEIPLDPDEARYLAAEQAGQLRIYTARTILSSIEMKTVDRHTNLIGYAVFLIGPALHYATSLQAVQDILYLDPSYRRAGIAHKLLKYAHEQLEAENPDLIFHHVKNEHPALGKILERMGYVPVETIYVRKP